MKSFLLRAILLISIIFPVAYVCADTTIFGIGGGLPAQSGTTSGKFLQSTGTEGSETWSSPSVTAGSSFDLVTTGTNTTATLTLGAGGTLTFTSTGIVNASQYKGYTGPSGTEFNYISGLTSSIQTQLNAKAPTIAVSGLLSYASPTISLGNINLASQVTGSLPFAYTSGVMSSVSGTGMVKVANGTPALATADTDYAAPLKVSGGLLSFSTPTLTLNSINLASQVTGSLADGYISSASTWNAKQAAYSNLTTIGALANGTGWLYNNGSGTFSYTSPTKSTVGLGNVENTALSTWLGSSNISTLGTITTGTWQGTAVADAYVASAATWNSKAPAIAVAGGLLSYASPTITLNSINLSSQVTGSLPYAYTSGIQSRVTGTCASGYAVQTIGSDGTVTCQSTGGTMTYPTGTGFATVNNGASWGTTYGIGTMTDGRACTYSTSGNTINCDTTVSGGGNVSNSGTPTQYQWAVWDSSTTIKGMSVTGSKVACTDANGQPTACTTLTDVAYTPALAVSGGLLSYASPTLTLSSINLASQVTGSLPYAYTSGVMSSVSGTGLVKVSNGTPSLATSNTDYAPAIKVSGGLLSYSTPTITLSSINLASQVTGSLPYAYTSGVMSSVSGTGILKVANGVSSLATSNTDYAPSAGATLTGTTTVGDASGLVQVKNMIPSSTGTWSGTSIQVTSSATLTAPLAIYINADGKAAAAQANATSTMPAMCLLVESATAADQSKACLVQGVYYFASSPTYSTSAGVARVINLSASTAGATTTTAPSTSGQYVQRIGIALTADKGYFDFNKTMVKVP